MMRKYVLICNNRRKKILYYYDFRDECVYCIDGGETSKNAEKGARKGGYYGGIIGIFLYPVLGKARYHLPSGMLACISVLMGLVAAIWVVNYSLNYTEKLFLKENALKLSVNECWQLYRDGKKFRIKFFWIKMLFFIFECIYLAALLKTGSKILFWINVLLCFILFICIYIERPICKMHFKIIMKKRKKKNEYITNRNSY